VNIFPIQQRVPDRVNVVPANVKLLIRRSIDLRRLYNHAACVSEPGLRLVLSDNAKTLDLLIRDLQAQLGDSGLKSPMAAGWRGTARRRLASWLMHATPRSGNGWIRLLGFRELALLQAFERAIAEAALPAALTLRRQLPRLHSIHLDMDILAGTARH
jgi:hypothetical protein